MTTTTTSGDRASPKRMIPEEQDSLADAMSIPPEHVIVPEEERSEKEEGNEGWKKYTKLVLPHVGLMCLTLTYTMIGASVFYSIERPHETKVKEDSLKEIANSRATFLRTMWQLAKSEEISEDSWIAAGERQFENVTDIMYFAFDQYFLTAKEIKENRTSQIWTYSTAVFFAVTVVTTIGYGNPVPITFHGRLVCIFFALFGIPLTLVTIADVGKFLSEHLIWLYGKYRYIKHLLQERLSHCRFRLSSDEGELTEVNHVHASKDYKLSNENLELEMLGLQSQKKIPATLVMAILIGYTALGGALLSYLETWPFFESFYFSFITMTTIGFGDIVPTKNGDIVIILIYIVAGLAVTTMCIDLVGVQYIRKIHYFGRRIQDARDDVLAIIGGKAVYISDLYATFLQKKYNIPKENLGALITDALVVDHYFLTRHLIPYIPRDIKRIRYIDETSESIPSSSSSLNTHSCVHCKYCANQQEKLRNNSIRRGSRFFTKLTHKAKDTRIVMDR